MWWCTYVSEERQHLVVRSVVGDEEAEIAVPENSSNTDQASSSSRHNAHVLPCVLALPPLAMVLIVQLRNRLSQRLDTSSRTVLAAMAGDVHLLGPVKAALDLVVNFRSTLAQVRPCIRVVEVAVLVGTLRGPYYTGRGTSGIETGVGLVALMRLAELAMDAGGELCDVVGSAN
jgi:hypothetical protein